VPRVLDPEEAHVRAARQLADLDGRRVLEIGCGEGRLTFALAGGSRSWLATDPNAESVELARRDLPRALENTVSFAVAGGADVPGSPSEFDLVFFSWSL
jgi:ubiquinone/menaquinone biosynthesis C-methylase UbiE